MESVGKTISQMNRSQQFNYEELVAQILAEPEIASFIQKEALSEAEIRRSISNLTNTSVNEIALSSGMKIILQEGISLYWS